MKYSESIELYIKKQMRLFPVFPRTKIPVWDDWPTTATLDPDWLIRFFKQNPDLNLGLVAGEGFVVIDIDGFAGESYKKLESLCGPFSTFQVRTGAGGRHLFFRAGPEIECQNGAEILPGVRVLSDGGFVVAPPSTHTEGRRYKLLTPQAEVLEMPDKLVELCRPEPDPLILNEPVPWPNPVDGEMVADSIRELLKAYLVLPDSTDVVVAIWILHTYAMEHVEISPILAVTSPEKRCGKTLLLEWLSLLVFKPLLASNVTPAVVFRAIDSLSPTLIIDEADTFISQNPELRGILNSSHRRASAFVLRAVKNANDYEPTLFSTWAPKAIAMIGNLPATLSDRAIPVRLNRKSASEIVKPFRRKELLLSCQTLRRKILRLMADVGQDLGKADTEVPTRLSDRAADNARPLLAIADLIGGKWPEEARSAVEKILGSLDEAENSIGVLLLADIREIFKKKSEDRLPSSDLVRLLGKMEDRPWPEFRRGEPLSAQKLASILKPFQIQPKQLNLPGRNVRGYAQEDFVDAFGRYCPDTTSDPLELLEPEQREDLDPNDEVLDSDQSSTPKSERNPHEDWTQAGQAPSEEGGGASSQSRS